MRTINDYKDFIQEHTEINVKSHVVLQDGDGDKIVSTRTLGRSGRFAMWARPSEAASAENREVLEDLRDALTSSEEYRDVGQNAFRRILGNRYSYDPRGKCRPLSLRKLREVIQEADRLNVEVERLKDGINQALGPPVQKETLTQQCENFKDFNKEAFFNYFEDTLTRLNDNRLKCDLFTSAYPRLVSNSEIGRDLIDLVSNDDFYQSLTNEEVDNMLNSLLPESNYKEIKKRLIKSPMMKYIRENFEAEFQSFSEKVPILSLVDKAINHMEEEQSDLNDGLKYIFKKFLKNDLFPIEYNPSKTMDRTFPLSEGLYSSNPNTVHKTNCHYLSNAFKEICEVLGQLKGTNITGELQQIKNEGTDRRAAIIKPRYEHTEEGLISADFGNIRQDRTGQFEQGILFQDDGPPHTYLRIRYVEDGSEVHCDYDSLFGTIGHEVEDSFDNRKFVSEDQGRTFTCKGENEVVLYTIRKIDGMIHPRNEEFGLKNCYEISSEELVS